MLGLIRAIGAQREARGLSQQAVARRAAITQSRYSAIERGTMDPRMSTLLNIARALDLEPMLVPKEVVPVVESLLSGATDAEDQPMFAPSGDA
jgi:transcriptional regulator with XRE-family HTH domain